MSVHTKAEWKCDGKDCKATATTEGEMYWPGTWCKAYSPPTEGGRGERKVRTCCSVECLHTVTAAWVKQAIEQREADAKHAALMAKSKTAEVKKAEDPYCKICGGHHTSDPDFHS